MARKSLVDNCTIDRALRAHNCQASSKHRLQQGDVRLKIKVERSDTHYCAECAEKILVADIAKLEALLKALRGETWTSH
jgi:hypothetical protein